MAEALESGAGVDVKTTSTSTGQTAASSGGSSEDLPTVGDIIESIGFGFSQFRATMLGGGMFLADGAELLLISSVAKAVSHDWNLQAMERGMLVTIVFLGILGGNIASGLLSEAVGRKSVITWSYLGLFTFSIASSFAAGLRTLMVSRLLVGTFIGLGQPAWNSIGAEIMPSAWRIFALAGAFCMFSVGELYSASLLLADDPSLLYLHWRKLLRRGAIPGGCLALGALLFLNESPVYLAVRGRRKEAQEVLTEMHQQNGITQVRTDYREPGNGSPAKGTNGTWFELLSRQGEIIFGQRLRGTTFVIMYSCFVLNFCYYGCMYAFPQVLAEVLAYRSAASQLLIGALWEFPGNAVGFLIGFFVPRKLGMKVYLVSQAIFMSAFVTGARAVAHGSSNWFFELCLYVGYYGVKTVGTAGFSVVYTYSSEIYPTEARSTGSAVNIAGGRAGSMLAPLVFEAMTDATGSFHMFFVSMILASLLNMCLIDTLRFETANMRLADSVDDHIDQQAEVASIVASDKKQSPIVASGKKYGATTSSSGSESLA